MVSLGVKYLYTSIPNAGEIKAVKESFGKHISKNKATRVITTFLAFILTLINFVFNWKYHLQIKGCAMGTICALSSASIFMDHFEKKYVYSFLQGIWLIYLQFIDDIFFFWTGTKEQLTRVTFWITCIKNIISSSLNIGYHKLASNFWIKKSLYKIINLLQKSIEKALTAKNVFM